MKGSWRTTVLGIVGGLTAILNAVRAILEGDTVDWGVTITAITTAAGLIFARDNKVSSESAGAK